MRRRKKNPAIIIAPVIAVAIVGACVWFFMPQTSHEAADVDATVQQEITIKNEDQSTNTKVDTVSVVSQPTEEESQGTKSPVVTVKVAGEEDKELVIQADPVAYVNLMGIDVGMELDKATAMLEDEDIAYSVTVFYVKDAKEGITEIRNNFVIDLCVEETLTVDKVKWFQEQLKIAGYFTKIDGSYGDGSKALVEAFTLAEMGQATSELTSDVEKALISHNKAYRAGDIDDLMVFVNKEYNLLSTDIPANLIEPSVPHPDYVKLVRSDVNDVLVKMFDAAKEDGINLRVVSAYRDYFYQEMLFSNYASRAGYEEANTYSALPGQSEHQTGLAVDIDDFTGQHTLSQSFETTEAFTWLDAHAHEYGFILRYPKDKEAITKYIYEPWHYRYIGDVELATKIKDEGLTFEEYMESVN